MSYLALLRLPGAARLVVGGILGRLSIVMSGLAFIFLVRETSGSYPLAGGVAAAEAVGAALAAAPQGRAVDRLGQARVLAGLTILHVAGLLAVLLAAQAHAPGEVLVALGACVGATIPPVGAAMRVLWPVLTGGGPALERAFALEAILQELVYIAGPLLVGTIVAIASPDAAVITTVVVTATGVALFVTSPISRAQRGGHSVAGRAGALAGPGIRTLMLATLPVGAALGTVEIVVPAFAAGHGSRAAAGVLLAVWGIGSMAGGLWFGAQRWRSPLAVRYAAILALLPAVALGLGLAWSNPTLGVLLFVAGAPIAPMFNVQFLLIDRLAPPGTQTEAFTLSSMAIILGAAIGIGAGGALVAPLGPSGTFAVGAAAAALAPLVVLARRRTLEPVAA